MKYILPILLIAAVMTGCFSEKEESIFSGRVEYFYYTNKSGGTTGFTRSEKGFPGTSTMVNEDVWVEVYPTWVKVELKNRSGYTYIIPRDRVVDIVVGTKEGNELNIPI
jgi:hypothetical protein